MSNFNLIYEWLKLCPQLYDLWVVSSLLEDNKTIIQPNRAANMYKADCTPYADGLNKYSFELTEPYYFDVDIVCYRAFYSDESQYNIGIQDSLQAVCDWLIEQQNEGNTPFEECYQIECLTPQPYIRGIYNDNDVNSSLVDYVLTVRFYTTNPAKRRVVVK